VNNLFANGPAPIGSADVNGDSQVTAGDVFYLITICSRAGRLPSNINNFAIGLRVLHVSKTIDS